MAFLEAMKDTLDLGDPTIRTWSMVRSGWAPFLCCAAYVFFVKRLGPDWMRHRKPFDLRLLMIVYNFSLVAAYAVCLLMLVYYLLTKAGIRSICSPNVVILNDWTYVCSSIGWFIYILKYVEFADTVFFLLRKKNHLVTNLHVIHHAVLPLICWIFLRTETNGFQFIPGGINSFVHIIMYSYYGLAAMGPNVQKYLWWKEHLTQLQMCQFVVILLFIFVVLPISGCNTSMHGMLMDTFFACLFLALFYNFYTKTYGHKKGVPDGKEPLQNGYQHLESIGLKQS